MERRNRKQEKKNTKQVSHRKVNLREGACYCWGNPGHISPDFPEAASSPKDKCALKRQHKIYVLSHRRLNLNLETKKQSAKYEEENISAVSSWIAVTQGFIQ